MNINLEIVTLEEKEKLRKIFQKQKHIFMQHIITQS